MMKTQISELYTMQVYTEKAVHVGEVENVVIDVDGKKIESLAVGKLNPELLDLKGFKGVRVPFRIVRAIGDIVIIRHIAGAFHKATQE